MSSLFYTGRKYGHLRSSIIVVIDSDYIWGYNDNQYNVASKEEWKKDYKTVFVARKGCLEDYFDIEEICDWYDDKIPSYKDGVFNYLCRTEMISVMTGGFKHPSKSTPYSPLIPFYDNEVLRDYGAAGLMVSGLLFGYPLESTVDLIKQLGIYW